MFLAAPEIAPFFLRCPIGGVTLFSWQMPPGTIPESQPTACGHKPTAGTVQGMPLGTPKNPALPP